MIKQFIPKLIMKVVIRPLIITLCIITFTTSRAEVVFEGDVLIVCTPHLNELVNAGIPRMFIMQRGNQYCVVIGDNSAELLHSSFVWLAQRVRDLAAFELDIEEAWEEIEESINNIGYSNLDERDSYNSERAATNANYKDFLKENPEYIGSFVNSTSMQPIAGMNEHGFPHYGSVSRKELSKANNNWLDDFLAMWNLDDNQDDKGVLY